MRDWKEVKEICDKVSPGPWEVKKDDELTARISAPNGWVSDFCFAGDASFIAIARTALPEAIAEIERLRKHNEELSSTIANMNADGVQLRQNHTELMESLATAIGWISADLKRDNVPPGRLGWQFLDKLREVLAKAEGGPA